MSVRQTDIMRSRLIHILTACLLAAAVLPIADIMIHDHGCCEGLDCGDKPACCQCLCHVAPALHFESAIHLRIAPEHCLVLEFETFPPSSLTSSIEHPPRVFFS